MSQDIFAVGDKGVWSGERKALSAVLRLEAEYGVGPFTFIAVQEVPSDKCCCGETFTKFGECPYGFDNHEHTPLLKSVGHSQWVSIETPKGLTKFSGAWFKKA